MIQALNTHTKTVANNKPLGFKNLETTPPKVVCDKPIEAFLPSGVEGDQLILQPVVIEPKETKVPQPPKKSWVERGKEGIGNFINNALIPAGASFNSIAMLNGIMAAEDNQQ